jgi:hypothetical protein
VGWSSAEAIRTSAASWSRRMPDSSIVVMENTTGREWEFDVEDTLEGDEDTVDDMIGALVMNGLRPASEAAENPLRLVRVSASRR